MIYISVGSNVGNRLSNLRMATELLKKRYLKDLKSSIILETEAILPNGAPSDWNRSFFNMVVYGSCSSSPEDLLKGLKRIESDIGRPQIYKKWEPRVIDLDILLWDGLTSDAPDLKIPHPELLNRPFLLHLMAMVNKNFFSNVQKCFLRSFTLSPKLVGIVNITPDSFSDGGLYYDANLAAKKALQLVSDGASIVDLGAQSTRPGALIKTVEEEYGRLKPVLDNLSNHMKNGDIRVSIDTFWTDVILNVLKHYNIAWINDQSGGLSSSTLKKAASNGCSVVIMHSLSIPPDGDNILPHDIDPIDTINNWAEKSINRLLDLGFDESSIIIDPGIGFGKSIYQNIQILRRIETLQNFGCKVLVAHSRKSFISSFSIESPSKRDLETIATSAILQNKVDFLRVHNVRDHMRFFVAQAVLKE